MKKKVRTLNKQKKKSTEIGQEKLTKYFIQKEKLIITDKNTNLQMSNEQLKNKQDKQNEKNKSVSIRDFFQKKDNLKPVIVSQINSYQASQNLIKIIEINSDKKQSQSIQENDKKDSLLTKRNKIKFDSQNNSNKKNKSTSASKNNNTHKKKIKKNDLKKKIIKPNKTSKSNNKLEVIKIVKKIITNKDNKKNNKPKKEYIKKPKNKFKNDFCVEIGNRLKKIKQSNSNESQKENNVKPIPKKIKQFNKNISNTIDLNEQSIESTKISQKTILKENELAEFFNFISSICSKSKENYLKKEILFNQLRDANYKFENNTIENMLDKLNDKNKIFFTENKTEIYII